MPDAAPANLLAVLALAFACSCAKTGPAGPEPVPAQAKEVVRLEIKPSATDPAIRASDAPHLVLYDPALGRGKLLLFLPGTGGVAAKGPGAFFGTALRQGYRVVSLSYVDTPAVS